MYIGVIGLGKLGRALVDGIIRCEAAQPQDIFVYDRSEDVRQQASALLKVTASGDINYVIEKTDIVFLTVKSSAFEEVAATIDHKRFDCHVFVSFMAGVSRSTLTELLPHCFIVRCVPTLAIAHCNGFLGYTKAPEFAVDIFAKLGCICELPDEDIEKVMAFTSCGLGFASMLLHTFLQAGIKLGFAGSFANMATAITFQNASELRHYRETFDAVATPGGATREGLDHLVDSNIYEIISEAIQKSFDKLKQELK